MDRRLAPDPIRTHHQSCQTALPTAQPKPQPTASSSLETHKPPLPTLPRFRHQPVASSGVEIKVPWPISGAITAALAKAIADSLGNELLAHYYLFESSPPHHHHHHQQQQQHRRRSPRVNLDRVLDRLLADFTRRIWDELWDFYHDGLHNDAPSSQVMRLFNGPVRQLILILNGPELAPCLLERLGPGLSRRPLTWSATSRGIDLTLALQMLCGYWHREFSELSPGGSPDEIGRAICARIIGGRAAAALIADLRRVVLSPHCTRLHLVESAVWDITLRRPAAPPSDGFHLVQFALECRLAQPVVGAPTVRLGDCAAITGTAADCIRTTVRDYVLAQWPRCGSLVLRYLEDAVSDASVSASTSSGPFYGMSFWDRSDADDKSVFCPALRLLHIEVEETRVRVTVSAWKHALVDVAQQLAWTCAALGASPFPGAVTECAIDVSEWTYVDDSAYVSCGLAHAPVELAGCAPWLQTCQGAVLATGFPIDCDRVL